MRRLLLAIFGVLLVGGALIAGGVLVHSHQTGLGTIYTDGQSIRTEADAAPIRSILWRDPTRLDLPIDLRGGSDLHISAAGDVVLFVRATTEQRLDIYAAHRTPDGWSAAQPLEAVNTRDNELSPALSPDGNVLLFASDRSGGLGGYDLWLSARNADGDWGDPVNAGRVNSLANEYAAAFVTGGEELYFTSDRAFQDSEPEDASWERSAKPRDANIYVARVEGLGAGEGRIVEALRSDADDLGPAFSPAGDFVYFASNRDGGHGGFDLYRARIVDGRVLEPAPLGPPVNTANDELDPMPWLDGFAVVYTAANVDSPVSTLLEARSREVYLDRDRMLAQRRAAALWDALWPWLLALLVLAMLLLLLAALIKAARNERLARGWRRLSLLAKCLLASVALHMLLMMLFAAWQVGSAIGEYFERPRGTRVALLDRGAAGGAGDIAQQIREAMTQAHDDPAQMEQQERAQLVYRPKSDLATEQLEATSSEADLQAMQQQAEAAEAAASRTTPAPQATPLEIAQAESEPAVETPDAPAGRAQAEAQHAAAAPARASTPQKAAMQSQRAAEVSTQAMAPSVAARQVEATAASTDFAAATASPEIDAPQHATAPTQVETLAQHGAVSTPQSRQAARADEVVRQPLVSAAATPSARPAPRVASSPSGQRTQQIIAPATSENSLRPGPATHEPTVADAASPSAAHSIVETGEVVVDRFTPRGTVLATPTAPNAQPGELAEVALGAPQLAEATTSARLPVPSISGAATAAPVSAELDPLASSNPIAAGTLQLADQGEVDAESLRTNIAQAQTDALSTPALAATSTVQLPAAVSAIAPAAADGAVQDSQIAEAPMRDIRPELGAMTGKSSQRKQLQAPGLQVDAAAPAVMARAVDAATATTGSSAPTVPALAEPVISVDAPALAASVAAPTASSMQSSDAPSDAVASALLEEIALPELAKRAALATGVPQRDALSAAREFDPATPDAGGRPASQAAPLATTESAGTPLPALASTTTLAMIETQPSTFAIPEQPRVPQMYPQREEQARKELVEQGGGSAETEAAVANALAWLARHQEMDGRWSGRSFDDICQCGGRSAYDFDKALTGLALLCFLGTNNTHLEPGPYQLHVDRALRWLIAQQREDGSLFYDESMYSHGIATIALCEAYGMTGDPELRDPVERAVDFIVRARNDVQGGWRYEPGQPGDTSVLGWQVMAMQSARKCGVDVPQAAFENARNWLEKVSLPGRPGLYTYQVGSPVSMSMTAEAMFVQQLLGKERDEPRMEQSAQYILREMPDWDRSANTYGWYYATLALFQHRGDAWAQWNEAIVEQLITAQRADGNAAGSWDPSDRWSTIGGRIYQTAICCLTLEVYYRYLPRFVDGN